MADAALSGLVSDVLRSLASTAFQEIGRLRRLKADVLALNDTYTQIQAVLNDAEVRQKKEKSVETWLNTLRSASLKVENILDDALTEAMLQRLHNERGIKYKLRAFFSSDYNPLLVRNRAANKVKTIRRKLDRIAANRSQFNFTSDAVSVDAGVGGETINMETTSLVPAFEIYGRDAEVKIMAGEICSKDRIRHGIEGVQVYAIWGMGGIGKTTLAQLVYNHERVKAHFELQSWVYVSSEFQVKKITREIIESIDKHPCQIPQLDAMQVVLQKKLKEKRFFIVLDDVWIEDRDMKKWEELSKALNSGAEGSIVMVTTRNQTTSRMMAEFPEFQHKVGCLSEKESWSLFKKLAFASGTRRVGEDISNLESIGKEIVHKCKGLPLAVKTLGGLMRSKRGVIEWQSVKDSEVWELQDNEILPALKLSYDYLLPHLKRCFAYCCLFPKGHKMGKDLLIELWIANGFLPPRGEVDLYVIGEEFFYCLVSRSFLQDVQRQDSMDLVCKMHDLMHDLARYVTRHDCSLTEPGKKVITPDEVLHFSSSCSDISFLGHNLKRLRSLRSIFIFADGYEGNYISQISKHEYLRVLRLDGIQVRTLPKSICKLRHLRYLSISYSKISLLPESIIYLQNLQVLVVRGCKSLYRLPERMRYMKNLRCLDNRDCSILISYMPVGMKELTCLQRLGVYCVGNKTGGQIGELGNLNLLGGRLELDGLENVGGLEEAKSANLKHKTKLVSLALYWPWGFDIFRSEQELSRQHEEVLEGLEPHSSLKELVIRKYMGKMISPSWMMKLGNLVRIRFWACGRCSSIPSLGKLPSLRVIELWDMHGVKCFDDDEFPGLQELNISRCYKFVSLPSNLPKLVKLDIDEADDLVSLPSNLPELMVLILKGCGKMTCLSSNMTKLKSLHLEGCGNLTCLPTNDLQQLRSLYLEGCRNLASLPSNLPRLSWLSIDNCSGLHCFPDGLKELTFLKIWGCENLEGRCEKEKGEDWPKISYVPNLYLRGDYDPWTTDIDEDEDKDQDQDQEVDENEGKDKDNDKDQDQDQDGDEDENKDKDQDQDGDEDEK